MDEIEYEEYLSYTPRTYKTESYNTLHVLIGIDKQDRQANYACTTLLELAS